MNNMKLPGRLPDVIPLDLKGSRASSFLFIDVPIIGWQNLEQIEGEDL